jgi:vacuolar-type H+-ATPase subunit I/STV1
MDGITDQVIRQQVGKAEEMVAASELGIELMRAVDGTKGPMAGQIKASTDELKKLREVADSRAERAGLTAQERKTIRHAVWQQQLENLEVQHAAKGVEIAELKGELTFVPESLVATIQRQLDDAELIRKQTATALEIAAKHVDALA